METNIRHDGQLSVVELTGSINSGNAHEFEDALSGEPSSEEGVIIDAGGLEYISSAGLRVLLKAQKVMNRQGSMKLIHVNEEVAEVFDITGFSDILTVE